MHQLLLNSNKGCICATWWFWFMIRFLLQENKNYYGIMIMY